MAKKTTSDPLVPFIEHHPVLMMGLAIALGFTVGKAIGTTGTEIYRAVRSNDRGEYGG